VLLLLLLLLLTRLPQKAQEAARKLVQGVRPVELLVRQVNGSRAFHPAAASRVMQVTQTAQKQPAGNPARRRRRLACAATVCA